jgi:hypothetical protein
MAPEFDIPLADGGAISSSAQEIGELVIVSIQAQVAPGVARMGLEVARQGGLSRSLAANYQTAPPFYDASDLLRYEKVPVRVVADGVDGPFGYPSQRIH